VGSSFKLLDDLIEVAPALGIHLEWDGSLPHDRALDLFEQAGAGTHTYSHEVCAWLALHQSAELSIKNATSIVFAAQL